MASLIVKQLRVSNVLRIRLACSFTPAVATDVCGRFSLTRRSMHHESVSLTTEKTVPRSFMREDAQSIFLFVDMPGIPKENVEVGVDTCRDLVIKGHVVKDYMCECRKYRDDIRLPENIKTSGIKANMKDGVLKVILPKTKEIKQDEEEEEEEEETINEFKVMVN